MGKQRKPRTQFDIVPWLALGTILVGFVFFMIVGKPTSCPRETSNLATSLPSCRGLVWPEE